MLVKKCFDKTLKPQSAFECTGLYPFNVEKIKFEKLQTNRAQASHVISSQACSEITVTGPDFRKEFESKLSPETLRQFIKQFSYAGWSGNPSYTKFFEFWKSLNPKEKVDDQLLSNKLSNETTQYLVQSLDELLSDDEKTSLHQLGDSTPINKINDYEDFSIFNIAGDGFLELVAKNNEYMTIDNSINNHKK